MTNKTILLVVFKWTT